MPFSLIRLSNAELEAVAASRTPDSLADRLEPDSLPPAFVAVRSLQLVATGHPEPWSTTFLILKNESNRFVGGCGFKTAPMNGRVEVGYGVSPVTQGNGAATMALRLLLEKAFEAGAMEVLAEVTPTNHASTRVVKKLGFEAVGSRVDNEGEFVVQWVKSREG